MPDRKPRTNPTSSSPMTRGWTSSPPARPTAPPLSSRARAAPASTSPPVSADSEVPTALLARISDDHLGDLLHAHLPPGAAPHLGSLGLLREPLASTLDGLVRREAGRRLLPLDPNVRPGLFADRAAYLRRLAEWVALADVVKTSDEDLAWLSPGES